MKEAIPLPDKVFGAPRDEVLKAMKNQAGNCSGCEVSLKGSERENCLVHRITPRFRGGQDRASNFELMCSSCYRDMYEMKVVAGKIPMRVHDDLIEWMAEKTPNATVSWVVRTSVEKQVSDDLVEITPQTLDEFLAVVAEVGVVRSG